MKLSFKKGPMARGLARVGDPYPDTSILGDKKPVGWISYKRSHGTNEPTSWRIWLHFKKESTKEAPSQFENRRLKVSFQTEPEAREYVIKHWESILKFNLHQLD